MSTTTRKRKHTLNEEEVPSVNKIKACTSISPTSEEQLTKILFGGTSNFLQSLEEAENETGRNIDSGVGETDESDDSEREKQPAWFDEEDDGIEVGNALDSQGRNLPNAGATTRSLPYQELLKQKFIAVSGTPKWATGAQKEDSDSEEILQTCGFVKDRNREKLYDSTLEYKKVKDLNCETYTEGPYVNAIEFHPTSSVALVAGNSGVASLFAVNGKTNSKLHSLSIPKYTIFSAKFINDGNQVMFGSKFPYIYTYDLLATKSTKIPLPHGLTQFKKFVISPDPKYLVVAGKFGEVHLLSSVTKERIALLKQDSEVTSLCFSPSGDLLFGHSDSGEITVWDMNTRRVRHKFLDDGCLRGTHVSVSPSNQFFATGSAQGVVNIYETSDVLRNRSPKPKKTALNLTTGITDLKFNPSSEILGFASGDIDSSVRLLHLGSMTVFNNFPSFGTKLGNLTVTNFSPGGGYFALGNKKSTVALYRLKHFKNY